MSGAAHHHEELQIQREIEETLLKAMKEPITAEDARLLSWAAGIHIPQLDKEPT